MKEEIMNWGRWNELKFLKIKRPLTQEETVEYESYARMVDARTQKYAKESKSALQVLAAEQIETVSKLQELVGIIKCRMKQLSFFPSKKKGNN